MKPYIDRCAQCGRWCSWEELQEGDGMCDACAADLAQEEGEALIPGDSD